MPRRKIISRGVRRMNPRNKRAMSARTYRTMSKLSRGISYSLTKSRQPHYHIRWENEDRSYTLAPGASAVVDALTFRLDRLRNFGELASLYDQYKITKVILYLNWSPLDYTQNTAAFYDVTSPIFHYFTDHDDEVPPGVDDFRERSKVKHFRLRGGKQYKIVLSPSVLNRIQATTTTQTTIPMWGRKLDMTATDVEHYGVKFGLEYQSHPTVNMGALNIRVKYYVTCYNTR